MKKKYRLKASVKDKLKFYLMILGTILLIMIMISLLNIERAHNIGRLTKECVEDGYKITARYTSAGDEYYVCQK